jgi:hypothetical protein
MQRSVRATIWVAIALIAAPIARAQNYYNAPMMEYLGYTQLYTQYSGNIADGSNVSVADDEASDYLDTADTVFSGKTLTPTSTYSAASDSDTTSSGHATIVGADFFGNVTGYSERSVAPNLGATSGGSSVQSYLYGEFLGAYLLDPGTAAPYGFQNNARVVAHTYTYNTYSLDTTERLDYLEQRDQSIQVVPNNDYGALGDTMNSIVVVSTYGATATTDAIGTGTPYTAGRCDPTVTGPYSGSPSEAIAQVAGVVGLLVSEGELTQSDYSFTTPSTIAIPAPYNGTNFTPYTKAGYTVTSGSTADVVKAALMAGALRYVPMYTTGITVGGITNYGSAGLTANGLDTRWGAGMVNAYNSYQIIHAGQQQSVEEGGATVGTQGFDYDPNFGGANGSGTTGTYLMTPTASGMLAISLVWNLDITGGTSTFVDGATLYNLNLKLIDVTSGGTVVATSASLVDNTQNIYANITGGQVYEMEVGTTSAPFDWGYGIAWQEIATPEPGSLGVLAMGALVLGGRGRRGRSVVVFGGPGPSGPG